MNGTQMLERALLLLGYTDAQGNVVNEGGIKARALAIVNTVYNDLYFRQRTGLDSFRPLRSLDDDILLPVRLLEDVMPYGVATYLAMGESDGDQQQIFAQMYNTRRAACSPEPRQILDVIPAPEG